MPTVVPSDLYPAVRRFLADCGLSRAVKAFDKETAIDADDAGGPALTAKRKKKASALESLELADACQTWLDARGSAVEVSSWDAVRAAKLAVEASKSASKIAAAVADDHDEEEVSGEEFHEPEPKPKSKKRRRSSQEEVLQAEEKEYAGEIEETEVKPKKKKRRRSSQEEVVLEETAEAPEKAAGKKVESEVFPHTGKKGKRKDHSERKQGVPFSRIDEDKWKATIKDTRLLDNTHKAKDKFGSSEGDAWGDKAAEDLLKVKGKGFRKEMAKKKRASWKGGGEIDQGVNSVAFSESDGD